MKFLKQFIKFNENLNSITGFFKRDKEKKEEPISEEKMFADLFDRYEIDVVNSYGQTIKSSQWEFLECKFYHKGLLIGQIREVQHERFLFPLLILEYYPYPTTWRKTQFFDRYDRELVNYKTGSTSEILKELKSQPIVPDYKLIIKTSDQLKLKDQRKKLTLRIFSIWEGFTKPGYAEMAKSFTQN
jgi:hypothetical protein